VTGPRRGDAVITDARVPAEVRRTLLDELPCAAADITLDASLRALGVETEIDATDLAMALERTYGLTDRELPDAVLDDWLQPNATVQTILDTLVAAGVKL
jgi:hypothetical protein